MPSQAKVGGRVVMLIAPAVVSLPNRVPCGPRSTSIWSMSVKSKAAVTARGRVVLAAFRALEARLERAAFEGDYATLVAGMKGTPRDAYERDAGIAKSAGPKA